VNEFIAIDFETADPTPVSAISVGLVKYRGGEEAESFYSLIRPPNLYVEPSFTDIHGLTVDDVKDAPDFAQVWETGMREFIGSTPLVAHNAGFDMKVLRCTLDHYGIAVPNLRYFCSLLLSRRTWPSLKSHALTSLGREFEIHYEAHNALADAQTCGKIILMCLDELSRKKGGNRPLAIAEALRKTGLEMKPLNRQ